MEPYERHPLIYAHLISSLGRMIYYMHYDRPCPTSTTFDSPKWLFSYTAMQGNVDDVKDLLSRHAQSISQHMLYAALDSESTEIQLLLANLLEDHALKVQALDNALAWKHKELASLLIRRIDFKKLEDYDLRRKLATTVTMEDAELVSQFIEHLELKKLKEDTLYQALEEALYVENKKILSLLMEHIDLRKFALWVEHWKRAKLGQRAEELGLTDLAAQLRNR